MTTDTRSTSSPGQATSRRAVLEAEVARRGDAALRGFLIDVESAALTYGFTASLLDAFSLGAITHRWRTVVDEMVRPVARLFGVTDPAVQAHPYLSDLYERIRASDVPDKAYSAARAVLSESAVQGWSHDRTAREMGRAMDAWTATLVPGRDGLEHEGVSWATQLHRIARTESTAAYNFHSLEALASDGYAHKRWVAHHDEITRPTHLDADGQTVPLASTFSVGRDALVVPGDPAGSPAEAYNCRCVIVGVES